MTDDERYEKANEFHKEFRALVHKYVGDDYFEADALLLVMLQEKTSVFNPFIWPRS